MKIILRADAKALGIKRYYTGKLCARGHDSERATSNGTCLACKVEHMREWAARNPDDYRAAMRVATEKNSERAKARASAWYYNNKERALKRCKEWAEKNKERMKPFSRAATRNRRARLARSDGQHSARDIHELLILQKYKCAACRASLKRSKYHVDHVFPISRGGGNGKDNLQILCAPCNLSKNAKDPIAWAQSSGRLL